MRKVLNVTIFAVFCAAFLLPVPGAAWGRVGHRAIGRIAERHLAPLAAAEVEALIGPESLAQVSTWADEMRSAPGFGRYSPWHYVSLPDAATYEEHGSVESAEDVGDLVEAVRWNCAVLRNRGASREERATALKWVVHLIGDIHQPLHAGRAEDRGGNGVAVTWHGEEANLHSVWDTLLIHSEDLDSGELAEFVDRVSADQEREWQAATLLDYVAESVAYRSALYEIGDGKLGYDYQFVHWPFVKKRIAQAGIRLAGLLNEIFAKAEPPP